MTKFPLYFNCHFFKSLGTQAVYTYKIDHSTAGAHPFQLFRRIANRWENLSVYASISDAVRTLLKELFSAELADEVSHGQATINPHEIIDKIQHGQTTISIGGHQDDGFRVQMDVTFEDMVER
jgi:hypothetical protein